MIPIDPANTSWSVEL